MIEDQAFVELARRCSKMCHVLETTAKEEDFSGLSELLEKALESLEKYVSLGQSFLLVMTSNARALCHIESKIPDRVPGAYYPLEHCCGTIEVSPTLWVAELQSVLEIIGVCSHPSRL